MSLETFSSCCPLCSATISSIRRLTAIVSRSLDLDVARLPLEAAPELVDEDLRVRERHPLPAFAGGKQQRSQRHRDPDAGGRHLRLDELDRVVDGEAGVDRAAGAIDVERDVLAGVLGLEME